MKEAILRVEEAISAIKNGEMIIVMDDEDRENEGDLVMAGIFSVKIKPSIAQITSPLNAHALNNV